MDYIPVNVIPITSDQAWHLMETDVTLRGNLIASALNEQFKREINAVYEVKHESESYAAIVDERAELEVRHTNLHAERLFEACCDAWEKQGRPKCRAFYLAIRDYCLRGLFDTRTADFSADMEARFRHLLGNRLSDQLRNYRRQMDRLFGKWHTKIEIESRDNGHQDRETHWWTPALVQQQIDAILLNDKRLEISREMQGKSIAAARLANNPHRWAEAELKLTDEWAEKLFNAWKEIWGIQGFPESQAFYRAIYDSELGVLFGVRRSVFQSACKQRGTVRRNAHFYSGTLGWFAREMNKLAAKWNRRMDVESQKSMYAARQERTALPRGSEPSPPATVSGSAALGQARAPAALSPAQVHHVALKFSWDQLADKFRGLQTKLSGRRFSADLIQRHWESGDTRREWVLVANPGLRNEFEILASIAARKLGCARRNDAHEYWLDLVGEWMQQAGLDTDRNVARRASGSEIIGGSVCTTAGFSTDKIAEISAQFCLKLIERGTPESAVSPPSVACTALQEVWESKAAPDTAAATIAAECPNEQKVQILLRRVATATAIDTMRTEEAAYLLQKSVKTVQRWVQKGTLKKAPGRGRILTRSLKRFVPKPDAQ